MEVTPAVWRGNYSFSFLEVVMNNNEEKENVCNEEVYEKFFAVVAEGKISQARIARELGVSSSMISSYKNRKYNGDVSALEEKIRGLLDREQRRLADFAIPIVNTTTIENGRQAIEMAHDFRDIAVIAGESGVGKTTLVNCYAEENPGAVLVIRAYKNITQRKMIEGVAKALGISLAGNQPALIDRVIETLKGRDAVLIVDEADYLTDASLELLRCVIVDAAGVGLALMGLPRLVGRLENVRNDHSQIITRVGTWLTVGRMKREDAEKIVRSVWKDIDEDTAGLFVKGADGRVRTLAKLLDRTYRILAAHRLDKPTQAAVLGAVKMVVKA
jgi:DNA transposition AAA+ family ATPase